MPQMERIIAKGQLVPLGFMQSDAAASQTNAALTVAEVRDVAALADDQNAADGYVVPWEFEVVGISVRASAARTAGSLTVEAMIAGAATGLTAVLNATDTQSAYKRQGRGSDKGAKGGLVGARITTDATWAPVTADVEVTVWVLVYLEGI
ncbi:MAG: hypothetical protein ACT4PO_06640 [Actinomycetota bacterium]